MPNELSIPTPGKGWTSYRSKTDGDVVLVETVSCPEPGKHCESHKTYHDPCCYNDCGSMIAGSDDAVWCKGATVTMELEVIGDTRYRHFSFKNKCIASGNGP